MLSVLCEPLSPWAEFPFALLSIQTWADNGRAERAIFARKTRVPDEVLRISSVSARAPDHTDLTSACPG